jgi:hypothetical protein
MRRWRYRLLQELYSTLEVESRRWVTLLAFAAFAYLQFYYAGVIVEIGRPAPLLVFVPVSAAPAPV